MDKLVSDSNHGESEQLRFGSIAVSELLDYAIGFLRRQYPILFLILICALAAGFVYLFTTPKLYTAHAMLLIDTAKMRVLQQQQAFGELPLDTTQVETQVEVLKSETIGKSVVKDLKLTEDPEFVGTQTGFVGALFGLVTRPFFSETPNSHAPLSDTTLSRIALGRLLQGREIRRVARTYVLDIAYTSLNPGRAASVANAIGEAYILDQLESKYQATRRASGWLQDRIAELRLQVLSADRAVLEFKEKNNIIGFSAGGGDIAE